MRHFKLLALAFACAIPFSANSQIEIGRTTGQNIYINAPASSLQQYTAGELQNYLKQIFKTDFNIIPATSIPANTLLLASDSVMPETKAPKKALKNDGFQLYTGNNGQLVIHSHNERGVLYGVYEFLETYLGCSFLASDAINVPSKDAVTLAAIDTTDVPETGWREVYYYELCDPHIAGMLRLNGNCSKTGVEGTSRYKIVKETHGGWGSWCHSMWSFLPKTLFSSHPEYFALRNGSRVAPQNDGTQACTANTDVWNVVKDNLAKVINEPASGLPIWADQVRRYWSVSQMDGDGPCNDPLCQAANAKYGNVRQGSILPMTNFLAKAFPDKKIGTLAYNYSRTAPTGIKCDSNVCIQLCSIEPPRSNINEPVATSSRHASFRNDLVAWGKICQDITLWFYEIQFQNLVAPFPDFNYMQSDIQYYVKNNTHGMFAQCSREKGGEFAQLRGYLLAKLLWNPYLNMKALETKFFNEYYGAGGTFVQQYFNKMHTALNTSGIALSMDGEPAAHQNGYLSQANVKLYDQYFDKAEEAVKDSAVLLKRVHKERLGIMYVKLRLNYGTIQEQAATLKDFYETCLANNVYMLSETDNSYQVGNIERFKTAQATRLGIDPNTFEYTCKPSGTMHAGGKAYVKSITSSGAIENVSYSRTTTPDNVYQVTDTIKTKPGGLFTLNAVANEAGERSATTVYQDLRYNRCFIYTDWTGSNVFSPVATLGQYNMSASTTPNHILANYDYVMNISKDFTVPLSTPIGTKARIRLQYHNAWKEGVGACGSVFEGMVYDIPVLVVPAALGISSTASQSPFTSVKVLNDKLLLKAYPGNYVVDVYALNGALLSSSEAIVPSSGEYSTTLHLTRNSYIVKVSNGQHTISTKVM